MSEQTPIVNDGPRSRTYSGRQRTVVVTFRDPDTAAWWDKLDDLDAILILTQLPTDSIARPKQDR